MRGSLRDHQREVRGILIIKSVAARGCRVCGFRNVYPVGILKRKGLVQREDKIGFRNVYPVGILKRDKGSLHKNRIGFRNVYPVGILKLITFV